TRAIPACSRPFPRVRGPPRAPGRTPARPATARATEGNSGAVDTVDPVVTYLDHAATTPMLPEAIEAMTERLRELGNPSSLHAVGRRARRAVEESREIIAEAFGARPSEVVFTPGGTEADNLAVKGRHWARRPGPRPHPGERGRAPRGPRRRAVARRPRRRAGRLDPGGRARARPPGRAARGPGLRGRRGARHRDVGQQRGRHRPARRRAGRD